MGQALYRKYRSKTLAEMVGQEHVTQALASAIKSGRISHAYLFTGPRGTGKTSAARIVAHEINHLPYDEKAMHLDIIEIDAASNRRIDDIRELRDRVHIAPVSATYKVYIIDEVHMLTSESFNALLKTLEEPPEHVVFILATTEVHKLPATIISRTQRYNFRLIEIPKVVAHLRFIADQEKISIDDSALELIAEHGEGSFRDSISLLDQLANMNNAAINAAIVERSLGLAPKQAVGALAEAATAANYQAIINQLRALEQQGTTTATLLPQLIRHLQAAAPSQPQLFGLIDQLLDVPRSYNPRLKLLTTLVQFAVTSSAAGTGSDPAPAPAKRKTAAATAAKPILRLEKPPEPGPKPPATADTPPEQPEGNKLASLTTSQWTDVLARIKQDSPPFYGMLRQAQPVFDASTQTLTLAFKYPLHRKKAEDNKAKKALADTFMAVFGGAPAISTTLDGNANAPDIAPSDIAAKLPAPDEAAAAVIATMGGGEVVHV